MGFNRIGDAAFCVGDLAQPDPAALGKPTAEAALRGLPCHPMRVTLRARAAGWANM